MLTEHFVMVGTCGLRVSNCLRFCANNISMDSDPKSICVKVMVEQNKIHFGGNINYLTT